MRPTKNFGTLMVANLRELVFPSLVLALAWIGVVWLVAACGNQAERDQARAELADLEKQRAALQANVATLSGARDTLVGDVDRLRQDETVMRAEKEGRGVHYVLRCSIRQIHYSFSIKKQIADAINEETFDLVTDKASYDRASKGTDLFDSFRLGSAVLKGSIGTWRIKVEDKRVEVDP